MLLVKGHKLVDQHKNKTIFQDSLDTKVISAYYQTFKWYRSIYSKDCYLPSHTTFPQLTEVTTANY